MTDIMGPQRVNTFRDMIIFVEVGRRETFTHAARALGLPVSTIARRVAALESELGLSLVERTTREQKLTADGLKCFERCRDVVDDALAAYEDVHAQAHGLKGRIRLALPGEVAAGTLARIVASFLRENEETDLVVEAAHDGQRLGHDLDLLICLGPPDQGALVTRRIGSIGLRLYASPGYLAEHGAITSRAGLRCHEFLAAKACADALENLSEGGVPAGLNCGGRLTVETFALVAELAAAGQGVALLPPDVAALHVRAGTLRPVLADWTPVLLPVFIVMASRLLPARVRSFVTHVVARFPAEAGAECAEETVAGRRPPDPSRGAGPCRPARLARIAPPEPRLAGAMAR